MSFDTDLEISEHSYEDHMDMLVAACKNPIPEDRVKDLLKRGGSVTLSLDGNAGSALLGVDLMDGEAEFIDVEYIEDDTNPEVQERKAIVRAFNNLKARCGGQSLSYNTCLASDIFGG